MPHYHENRFQVVFIKMEIPRLDGTDALGWIFKISHFFYFHNTAEEKWISIACFYLDGAALRWYQWIFYKSQLTSWINFLYALQLCFGPSQFNDPQGALFKLIQTATVREYQTQFENGSTQIIGLPPHFLLSYFISGLKPHIRGKYKPYNLYH